MKESNNRIIEFNSVDAYNRLYGLKSHHPLVTVIDLMEGTKELINNVVFNYGVYAIYLKNNASCRMRYGQKEYDYKEGTVVTFSPGTVVDIHYSEEELTRDVVGLIFHPDLIFGTPLGEKIGSFGYFHYSQKEALHLSDSERELFLDCLMKIKKEVEHPIDNHSANLISAYILLLLEYMSRFYDRQFITRHRANSDVVREFEKELQLYFDTKKCRDGVPTVAYFAEHANLTPGYFGDLVKRETGITAQEVITNQVIREAKQKLASTSDDVAIIAYDLGFQYPQHFARLFKKETGMTPTQYRKSLAN